jgi:hypothetical protein
MQISLTPVMCLLTALIVVAGATHAAATPLNPFRYARRGDHCPVDTVVWLDFRKGIYYFKQQPIPGGLFLCRPVVDEL